MSMMSSSAPPVVPQQIAAITDVTMSTRPLTEAATDRTTALTTDVTVSIGPSTEAATDRTTALTTMTELAEEEKGVQLRSVRASATPNVPGTTPTVISVAKNGNALEKITSLGAGITPALILATLILIVEMPTILEPVKQRELPDATVMMKAVITTASPLGMNRTGVAP